jgi:hypothetical protein
MPAADKPSRRADAEREDHAGDALDQQEHTEHQRHRERGTDRRAEQEQSGQHADQWPRSCDAGAPLFAVESTAPGKLRLTSESRDDE